MERVSDLFYRSLSTFYTAIDNTMAKLLSIMYNKIKDFSIATLCLKPKVNREERYGY